MSVTRNELHRLTLSRIDEREGSTVAALFNANDSGNPLQVNPTTWAVVTSGGTTLTTEQLLDFYLNEAAAEWCQTAFYLEGSASLTWATTRFTYRLNELTAAASQGNLHSVEQVTKTVSSVVSTLPKITRDALRLHYPEYRTTSATPSYWAFDQYTLHLQAKPLLATDMSFYGPCLPQSLGDGSGSTATSAAWMEDSDLRRVLPCLAAMMMIRRKITNESLYGRFEELALEYQDLYARFRGNLSPSTLAEHFKDMSPDMKPRGK